MRIRLTLLTSSGNQDCILEVDSDATVTDVASVLASHTTKYSSGVGSPEIRWTLATDRLGVLLGPTSFLTSGIPYGSSVWLVREPELRHQSTAITAPLALRSCNQHIPLRGKRVWAQASLPERCRPSSPLSTVMLERLGKTWHVHPQTGMTHNGLSVHLPTRVDAGDRIQSEDAHFTLHSSPDTPVPDSTHEGIIPIARSPRRREAMEFANITISAPPTADLPVRWPSWTIFGSLISSVAMYFVWPEWYIVVWMGMSSVWMVFSVIESRKHTAADHKLRLKYWEAELETATAALLSRRSLEQRSAHTAFPSSTALIGRVRSLSGDLWDWQRADTDRMHLRLGCGSLPSAVSIVPNTEIQLPRAIAKLDRINRVPLSDHPLTVSLPEGPLGICGSPHLRNAICRALVLQLVTRSSPADCTLHWVGEPPRYSELLPHCAAAHEGPPRSTSHHALSTLISTVQDGPQHEGHVIIVDLDDQGDSQSLLPAIRLLAESGAMLILLSSSRDALPPEVTAILDCSSSVPVRECTKSGERWELTSLELLDEPTMEEMARRLAPLRDAAAADAEADIPAFVGFTELQPQQPSAPLAACIGAGASSPITLDLRNEGPHALVAGTTGSGKSELLRSWVAGLASSASPLHVTFMLVDYKGGSAFRECAELPHVVGLLTDLDEHLTDRVLRSLRAEIRRRERILAEHAAMDLPELESRGIHAFPSMVIVIDEFAALVREVPDFITGVIDIAQRGRSLGVHLVLATQRPSGVITDSIRANTNIRICLGVTDAEDSTDVLGIPDAAHIESRRAGRAFLRIGSGPVISFQSMYVSGNSAQRKQRRVRLLSGFGTDHPPANEPAAAVEESDLSILVEQLRAKWKSIHDEGAVLHTPWVPPLPDLIPLDALSQIIGRTA